MDYLKKAKQFRTKKKLGQNFLVDSSILKKIVEEANISADETIVEIGAGLGFVTLELAKSAKKVIAIEIDPQAIAELKALPVSNIEILNQDILKTEFSQIIKEPVKVVANIPYYITSPILVHLLGDIDQVKYSNRQYIREIILMVQYEVAKRIVATEKSPGKEYGLLSILSNYWTKPEFICKVPSGSFYPAPKVDSALIKLVVRDKPAIEIAKPELFRRVVQAGFGMRRKTIKNALIGAGFDTNLVMSGLERANINSIRRGETLSIEEFRDLTNFLDK